MERAPGSLWFCFPPSVPLPPPIHPVWFCCCFCTRSQEGWAYETKLQFSSVAQSCPTLCDPVDCSIQASLSITNSWSLLKLMSISSSVIPFSSYFQSFPASGSFQMSRFFASGGQNVGVSASASVLPKNIQD